MPQVVEDLMRWRDCVWLLGLFGFRGRTILMWGTNHADVWLCLVGLAREVAWINVKASRLLCSFLFERSALLGLSGCSRCVIVSQKASSL